MPEEKCEDETNSNSHHPGSQHEHQQSQVGQGLEKSVNPYINPFKYSNQIEASINYFIP